MAQSFIAASPLYYFHFEITQCTGFSQYQYFIVLVARLLLWNSENREHMKNFRNVDCVVTNYSNVQDRWVNLKTTN